MKLVAQMDNRMELRAFTPENFDINNPLVSAIQDTGIRIA